MRSEISAAELEAAAKAGRHFVVCAQPHGVISFAGICSAVVSPRAVLVGFPTAVASVILKVTAPVLLYGSATTVWCVVGASSSR